MFNHSGSTTKIGQWVIKIQQPRTICTSYLVQEWLYSRMTVLVSMT